MTTNPPPRYIITKLSDFAAIPPDRIDACLAEFRSSLAKFRDFAAKNAEAISRGKVEPSDVMEMDEFYEWTDDGRSNEFEIRFNEGGKP